MQAKKNGNDLLAILLAVLVTLPVAYASAGGFKIERRMQQALTRSKARAADVLNARPGTGMQVLKLGKLRAIGDEIKSADLMLRKKFAETAAKINKLGSKAKSRQAEMLARYDAFMSEVESLIEASKSDPSALDRLVSLYSESMPSRSLPIFGNLPYHNLHWPAILPLAEPAVTPAYLGGDGQENEDDLLGTPEAPINREIVDLAQSLDWSPAAIYDYLKNNVETEWYYGCMKGAVETLRQGAGNDCDQAALLVALMRASGYPARYVSGVIEFFPGIEKALELTGVRDESELAGFFQKAGIPFEKVISGSHLSSLKIEHIWVEARVPYANYRGVVMDESGKSWLGLDTSIKAAGYEYTEPPSMPDTVHLGEIRDYYLQADHPETPLEYLRAEIEAALDQAGEGVTYSELLRTRSRRDEEQKILPASLQFTQDVVTAEYTRIPDELLHKAHIEALDLNGGVLFDITLNSMDLSNRSLAIYYEPETVEDQEIINSFGGLDNTPAYLVRLRPVLKVDGERTAVGRDGLAMGETAALVVDLIAPAGTTRVTNDMTIGNLMVMGLVAGDVVEPEVIPQADRNAERLLHEEALRYIKRSADAEDELAALLGVAVSRPIPTLVTVGGVIDVTYLLDVPHGYEWKGVFVDADQQAIEATGSGQSLFMQLAALEGSVLEDRLLREDFQVDSISTARLFALANNSGTEILTVDATNVSTVLPGLPFSDRIKDDIANAVNQGQVVTVPGQELTFEDWTGVGYLKEDPQSGESGWMLSGMIAGGMTVWGLDQWPEEYLDLLTEPNTQAANPDPTAVATLKKLSATDNQYKTVGEEVELMVIAQDAAARPVRGVRVMFTVKDGCGWFGDNENQKTYIPENSTGNDGVLKVGVHLGKKTSCNPTWEVKQDDKYATQLGLNIVDAKVVDAAGSPTLVALRAPFAAKGMPGPATNLVRIKPTSEGPFLVEVAALGTTITVGVEDEYDNPVSNYPVEFTAGVVSGGGSIPPQVVSMDDSCTNSIPTHESCETAAENLVLSTSPYGVQVDFLAGGRVDTVETEVDQVVVTASPLGSLTYIFNTDLHSDCAGSHCVQDGVCDWLCLERSWQGTQDLRCQSLSWYTSGGELVNAGRAGEPTKILAGMVFMKEERVPAECGCGYNGTGNFAASLSFEEPTGMLINGAPGQPVDGAGNPVDPSVHGFSRVAGDYQLPQEPGLYEVPLACMWTAYADWALYRCDEPCTMLEEHPTFTEYSVAKIWSVKIEFEDEGPLYVPVDLDGVVTMDQRIGFVVQPAAPSRYVPVGTNVLFMKDGIPIQWTSAVLDEKNVGQATVARGTRLEQGSDYDVQVVLNAGTEMEIRSEKARLVPSRFYVEHEDSEYPLLKLRPNDYYPALGAKKVSVRYSEPRPGDTVRAEIVYPTEGMAVRSLVNVHPGQIDVSPGDGRAQFEIDADPEVVPAGVGGYIDRALDHVVVKFKLVNTNGELEAETLGTWKIRNNANVEMGDVFSGEAVFVRDDIQGPGHAGVTDYSNVSLTDEGKKVDFVQELLNQVVPRKRGVDNYVLLDEDGEYGPSTASAVYQFQQNFALNTETMNDGKTTFRKVQKDYGTADAWLIVDKETLVGMKRRTTDLLINGTSGSGGDTGLYELYDNVVRKFIDSVIHLAESYATNSDPNNENNSWVARTGEVEGSVGAVSYSFGGRKTIQWFNDNVSKHGAPTYDQIENTGGAYPLYTAYQQYNGNIQDASANETDPIILQHGIVGSGTKKWPGLYESEWHVWLNDQQHMSRYGPWNWAGIDCNGFAMQSMRYAELPSQYSAEQYLTASGDKELAGVELGRVCVTDSCPNSDRVSIHSARALSDVNVKRIFSQNNDELFYYWERSTPKQDEYIRKGDYVRYGNSHISIVYSERPTIVGNNVRYQIIHAYGVTPYTYPTYDPTNPNIPFFSRKVIVTWQNITSMPSGFGRIKLW